ncbi:MAG: DUF4145 domain-containing protein [Bryobacteraceae bacterium]
MLIDCTHCQARVNGEILKLAAYHHPEEWTSDYQIALLRCPECNHLLVGEQAILRPSETDAGAFTIADEEWLPPSRVWPEPVTMLLELSIPDTIRVCLLEAQKCLHATAYTACVAMSGRAIEAMCGHFSTKKDMLFEGLKELHERGVIDRRLYEWGDELRKHRNLAAHASGVDFNLLDAKDLYEFSTATASTYSCSWRSSRR